MSRALRHHLQQRRTNILEKADYYIACVIYVAFQTKSFSGGRQLLRLGVYIVIYDEFAATAAI